jgi:tRNA threonylcarbamoyladenosine biosynthesis protein TsaE
MNLIMKKSQTKIFSQGELDAYGVELLSLLQIKTTNKATVLALSGDLGAGKTTFVQSLARDLGVVETVTSPTFVIMKRYDTTDKYFSSLVHIDAYRIEDIVEMKVLGFELILDEPNTLVCIEWAERIKDLLPEDCTHLKFVVGANESRIITRHEN